MRKSEPSQVKVDNICWIDQTNQRAAIQGDTVVGQTGMRLIVRRFGLCSLMIPFDDDSQFALPRFYGQAEIMTCCYVWVLGFHYAA